MLMVSALTLSISNYSYAQGNEKRQQQRRDSSKRSEMWTNQRTEMDSDMDMIIAIPNLTADQKTKIDAMKVKYLKESTTLNNELAEKEAHLKVLETADNIDRVSIDKTIDEIGVLQAKILRSKVNHRLEIASILTADQKVYFNAGYGQNKTDKNNMNVKSNRLGKSSTNSNSSNSSSSGSFKK